MSIPLSTYRLQFTPTFPFKEAIALLDYFQELGITHLYASPISKARRGSSHGYDVIDPNLVNPELGGEEAVTELLSAARDRSIGWIQDIVPNHMALDAQNTMLMDIFEHGTHSPFSAVFDIEWNHPYESLRNKLLVPFLGKFYGECLEAGEIVVRYDQTGFSVNYYELRLPLKVETYSRILSQRLPHLKGALDGADPDLLKYQGVLHALRSLPASGDRSERMDQVTFIKRMLWELYLQNALVRESIDDTVRLINGQAGIPESFNLLDELLAEQMYRLSFWKVATEEINYRRFFNINQLISVRVEDPQVFENTHRLIQRLLSERMIDGVRIDHIDGLYDPARYLDHLRRMSAEAYIVVEKILQDDETLPASWPVHGTTGYDFLSAVNGLFCERKSDRKFDSIYQRFSGRVQQYETLIAETKRLIIGRHMAGDVDRLAHLLKNVSTADRYARDITLYGLRRALVELLTFFPAYRTYINQPPISESDRQLILECVQKAAEASPALVLELDFVKRFLLLDFEDHLPSDEADRWLHFVMRFQQLTGPLMAKGFEDTALYRYNKLLSLNDVGGNPRRFGISPLEFHHFNKKRAHSRPHSLNATATHDTKRGEDFRARLTVISERPDEWLRAVTSWSRMNSEKKIRTKQREIPDKNDEYLYYQTLVGSFPFTESERTRYADRLKDYIIKAVREAKIHTAWLKPDVEYEGGFLAFIDATLNPSPENRFREEFLEFQSRVAQIGILNSLSQVVLKAMSPGIPDFYQGSEFWDFSFVDPDNRRAVDFSARKRALAEIKIRAEVDLVSYLRELLDAKADGKVKLYTTHRLLQLRKEKASLFLQGEYVPLNISGQHRNHVLAFLRKTQDQVAVVVVPRRCANLIRPEQFPLGPEVWEETRIELPMKSAGQFHNIFTREVLTLAGSLPVSMALSHFPVFVASSEATATQ